MWAKPASAACHVPDLPPEGAGMRLFTFSLAWRIYKDVAKTIQHGTVGGYARCREHCAACKSAWATYIRSRKRRLGVLSRADREIASAESLIQRLIIDDLDVTLPVTLSPLGYQILVSLQRKTHHRRGEVLDQLLREHGQELTAIGAA